ncbi:MAG: hypothetical protein V3U26_01370, partial [Dehalococcoidia bacterium]
MWRGGDAYSRTGDRYTQARGDSDTRATHGHAEASRNRHAGGARRPETPVRVDRGESGHPG